MPARFASDSSTSARARGLRSALLAFALIASLYLIDVLVLQNVPEAAYVYAANYALPFDLMVGVPLIIYLLAIRRKKLTPLLVLPMMWAGGAASAFLAAPGQPSLVPVFAAGCAVVEITIFDR